MAAVSHQLCVIAVSLTTYLQIVLILQNIIRLFEVSIWRDILHALEAFCFFCTNKSANKFQ